MLQFEIRDARVEMCERQDLLRAEPGETFAACGVLSDRSHVINALRLDAGPKRPGFLVHSNPSHEFVHWWNRPIYR